MNSAGPSFAMDLSKSIPIPETVAVVTSEEDGVVIEVEGAMDSNVAREEEEEPLAAAPNLADMMLTSPVAEEAAVPTVPVGQEGGSDEGGDGGEAAAPRTYCTSAPWHLQGGLCTNSPKSNPPGTLPYDALVDCCDAAFGDAGCGPWQIENVCDLDHLLDAEYAEAAETAGEEAALGCDPSPCQPLQEMGDMDMGAVNMGAMATAGGAGGTQEEEGLPSREDAPGLEAAGGDAAYCASGKWHLDPASGKCSNRVDGTHDSAAFETPGECCVKHFLQECSVEQVENVCDLAFGAGDGGAAAAENEGVAAGEGAALLEGEDAEDVKDVKEQNEGGDEKGAAEALMQKAEALMQNKEAYYNALTPSLGAASNSQDAPELGAAPPSSTEGQGAESTRDNAPGTWEGEETQTAIVAAEPGNARDDGAGFHVLRPKGVKGGARGKGGGAPVQWAGAALVLTLAACCYYRRRRGGRKAQKPRRGTYAALGSDDVWNGTFSDDISLHEKDSDDEGSLGSYGSADDGAGGLEMGGIHETDANGGLTLGECNG